MNTKAIHAGLATLCLMTLSVLFSSCEHKDLCYRHPHVKTIRVAFDWRNAPDASPKGMCVYFYPTDGSTYRRFDFQGLDGGEIEHTVGGYRANLHKKDYDVDHCNGMEDFDTHFHYTRQGYIFEPIYGNAAMPAPSAMEDELVCISPGEIVGGRIMSLVVDENGVSFEEETPEDDVEQHRSQTTLTLYPVMMTCHYTFEIRNVKNLKYADQMSGSLSGLNYGIYPGRKDFEHKGVTVPFSASSSGQDMITGDFYTYGHCQKHNKITTFTLYVWMNDDKKYYYTWNVTDQVQEAPDPRNVHIVIDNVDLPQPITNGSGYDVDVDDWLVVEEEIKM